MTDSLSAVHHLIDDAVGEPNRQVDDVYRSSNGDHWQLIRESSTGRIMVRHTPNVPSGGAPSEVSVEEFLASNGSGPEHGALRVLLRNIAAA